MPVLHLNAFSAKILQAKALARFSRWNAGKKPMPRLYVASSRRRMNIVNPINFLRRLGWRDVQINHDGLLTATHDHAAQWFVAAGVDLLVRYKGRDIYKIAGTGVGEILKAPHRMRARPLTT
jgi:hypothetical protein